MARQSGRARLKRLAAAASVSVAAVLIIAKISAWLATGSVSLLSTLIDSILDLAASLINLFAIRQALQPPDREHRFGHGKAEPLAGLAQAAFIAGSAVFLLFHAGERLLNPTPITNTGIGYAVMVFSMGLTLALVVFQRFVIRRTGSIAIRADALHYAVDLLTNTGVIVALVLSTQFGWLVADPLIAIAIAVFILSGARGILKRSLDLLMDRELPETDRQRIREVAKGHPGVIDVHDIRTRCTGTDIFVQLHLEMDPSLTLLDAHTIADQVSRGVEQVIPGAEVLIHQDPHGIPEARASFR
ncbi:MAG: cation diffusion facilitator family transporter [Rhodospirillales bacterium]|nr:MAG: cation diffusion facilitator family transporter [Rhodospirillales bacterium]